jgi:hypothetical protein
MIYFLPGPSYLPSPLIKNIFSGHKKKADLPFKPENQPSNIHFGGSNPSSTPHASLKPHTLFRGIKMPQTRLYSGFAVCASFKTTLYGRWGLKRCNLKIETSRNSSHINGFRTFQQFKMNVGLKRYGSKKMQE